MEVHLVLLDVHVAAKGTHNVIDPRRRCLAFPDGQEATLQHHNAQAQCPRLCPARGEGDRELWDARGFMSFASDVDRERGRHDGGVQGATAVSAFRMGLASGDAASCLFFEGVPRQGRLGTSCGPVCITDGVLVGLAGGDTTSCLSFEVLPGLGRLGACNGPCIKSATTTLGVSPLLLISWISCLEPTIEYCVTTCLPGASLMPVWTPDGKNSGARGSRRVRLGSGSLSKRSANLTSFGFLWNSSFNMASSLLNTRTLVASH